MESVQRTAHFFGRRGEERGKRNNECECWKRGREGEREEGRERRERGREKGIERGDREGLPKNMMSGFAKTREEAALNSTSDSEHWFVYGIKRPVEM